MIKIILIIVIIIVLIKIFSIYFDKSDAFINITNPFVDGLSQFQLGADVPDSSAILDGSDLPPQKPYNPFNPANNQIAQSNNPGYTYYPDQLDGLENLGDLDDLDSLNKYIQDSKTSKMVKKINKLSDQIVQNTKSSKFDQDLQILKDLKNKKQMQKNMAGKKNSDKKIQNKIPCKKLNKFFVQTQFSDSYRDVLTAFNYICPDQKILFNLQTLPVVTTNYQLSRDTPFVFIKLVTQFINKVNKEIKSMPESYEIVNNFNNYMPLTSQLKKYTENKGINKFYKDIGVDYNLYADTPPNSPIELIKIIKASREYTDAETKYVITFVIKKILKSVSDQLQITVHFVTKNDPLEGYNMFDGEPPAQAINSTQQVAIEFVFIDGYYTNDFDVDYDCMGTDNNCKKFSNIDGDDKYYSFDALGTEFLTSDYEIIKQFNKKNREHEIEMNNFNINVPYPVYENHHKAKFPQFPRQNL
jgi:hypothetical protein